MQGRPTSAGGSVQSRLACINWCIYLCAVIPALFGFWTEGRWAVLVGYMRVSTADQIARGELRPLRDPQNADDDG